MHLEAEVFDLMTAWIQRYRQRAEERCRQLDAVLAQMNEHEHDDQLHEEGSAS